MVSTELTDPAVTGPEDEQVQKIVAPVTTNKLWQGVFTPARFPVTSFVSMIDLGHVALLTEVLMTTFILDWIMAFVPQRNPTIFTQPHPALLFSPVH